MILIDYDEYPEYEMDIDIHYDYKKLWSCRFR